MEGAAAGSWHLRLCNRTQVLKTLLPRHRLSAPSLSFQPSLSLQSHFPSAAYPQPEEKPLASQSSLSHRPSFQTRPPVHRDPFCSPRSRWAGTTVTNSAQGVDYPSQPSLWLASHLHPGSHSPSPTRGWALGKAPPNPHPTASRAAAAERGASVLFATSELAPGTLQLLARSTRSPRTPCLAGRRAALQPRGGMRALLSLGSPSATAWVRDPRP